MGGKVRPNFDRPAPKFLEESEDEESEDEEFDTKDLEEYYSSRNKARKYTHDPITNKQTTNDTSDAQEPKFKKFFSIQQDSEESSSDEKIFEKHDPWYFDLDLNDEEVMDLVYDRLSDIKEPLTYKIFKAHLLPKHRKPTFSEYARLRKLEKIMLKQN